MLRPTYCLVRNLGRGNREYEFAEFETPLSDAHAELLQRELRAAVTNDLTLETVEAVDIALARFEAETHIRGRVVDDPFPASIEF